MSSKPSCPSASCAAYTFNLPSIGGAYFNVWNTGSVALAGLSYQATWSGGGDLTLYACSVPWVTLTATCATTAITVFSNQTSGSWEPTTSIGAFPITAGAEIYLYAVDGTPAPSNNVSVTISASVCSGGSTCGDGTTVRQIRAVQTTNA